MGVQSRLSRYLPPFASDYAGAASALYGLGGMVVLCDAGCCTDHYVFYDEPRWEEMQTDVFSTTLRTMDAVLGCDDGVVERVCETVRSLPRKPAFVAFITTPVPALVGMDAKGVAYEIEAELGIPAIGLEMSGFRYYDYGVEAACKALVEAFGCEGMHGGRATDAIVLPNVNVIGATPFDFDLDDLRSMRGLLEDAGVRVNAFLPCAESVGEIGRIGEADLNLAVTAAGLKVAKWLKRKYGTPYLVAATFEGSLNLLDSIACDIYDSAQSGVSGLAPSLCRTDGDVCGKRILIIGDQVVSQSLAASYLAEGSGSAIAIASPFAWDRKLAEPQDFRFEGEFDLAQKAAEFHPDVIMADPMYAFLQNSPKLQNATFVPRVHPAVSSRLTW